MKFFSIDWKKVNEIEHHLVPKNSRPDYSDFIDNFALTDLMQFNFITFNSIILLNGKLLSDTL